MIATAVSPAARAESPGLWTLAWRRFRRDRLGVFSLVVVMLFLVLALASASGLVASDWGRELGVSYAPPSFVGPDAALRSGVRPIATQGPETASTTRSRAPGGNHARGTGPLTRM